MSTFFTPCIDLPPRNQQLNEKHGMTAERKLTVYRKGSKEVGQTMKDVSVDIGPFKTIACAILPYMNFHQELLSLHEFRRLRCFLVTWPCKTQSVFAQLEWQAIDIAMCLAVLIPGNVVMSVFWRAGALSKGAMF